MLATEAVSKDLLVVDALTGVLLEVAALSKDFRRIAAAGAACRTVCETEPDVLDAAADEVLGSARDEVPDGVVDREATVRVDGLDTGSDVGVVDRCRLPVMGVLIDSAGSLARELDPNGC